MIADRIEKLRAALEHIRDIADAEENDTIYDAADEALDADERARLCAPSEDA